MESTSILTNVSWFEDTEDVIVLLCASYHEAQYRIWVPVDVSWFDKKPKMWPKCHQWLLKKYNLSAAQRWYMASTHNYGRVLFFSRPVIAARVSERQFVIHSGFFFERLRSFAKIRENHLLLICSFHSSYDFVRNLPLLLRESFAADLFASFCA